jgi:hypothetical protein
MFDLESEMHAWCQSVLARGWNRAAGLDELKDHLYCEIERLSAEGLSEEQAFLTAIERMGNVAELRIEHSKNRNLAATLTDNMTRPTAIIAVLHLALGILFAATTIFADSVFEGTQHNEPIRNWLLVLYWVPFSILTLYGARQAMQLEHDGETC